MDITDKQLIDSALSTKAFKEFLHMDTISILEYIAGQLATPNSSFRSKDITQKILQAWVSILQDSILNLKSSDYRELSHWERNPEARQSVRDINNEFVFGLDRLRQYFNEFTEFEGVLYGVDGGYRDHVIHVLRVWLLGVTILYAEPSLGININDIELPSLNVSKREFTEEEIFSMWSIIALCHDLGYPLEKAEQINDSVEKMYRHLGKMHIQKFSASFHLEHQFINKFLLDFISSKIEIDYEDDLKDLKAKYPEYTKPGATELKDDLKTLFMENRYYFTSIQSKFYLKFAKSFEYYSHGIISSSILLKSLFFFLESDFNMHETNLLSFEDARQFIIRREILRSIASHTCPEVYHLKANTLAFFLILCDELQEWDRPCFSEMLTEGEDNQRHISVHSFSSSSIEFSLHYKGIIDSDKYAKKIFKKWHTILRSAVFDRARTFELKFTLKINNIEYRFKFKDNKLDSSKRDDTTNKFEIYSLKD